MVKATIYVTDKNGYFENPENLIDEFERISDDIVHVRNIQQSQEFEWSDEMDINFSNISTNALENYFGDTAQEENAEKFVVFNEVEDRTTEMSDQKQDTAQNKVLEGSMKITTEEFHILLSVLQESIEQKRVQLQTTTLRRECFKDNQLIEVENYVNAEIDKHINLLRKVTFYEQGS